MLQTFARLTARCCLGLTAVSFLLLVTGCDSPANSFTETQEQLYAILQQENLPAESKYTIINRIANNLLAIEEYNQLIILLTGYVEDNPADMYNAYWLLMTAYVYMQLEAKPMAEYYFDRIINTCQDLEVQGQSIHFLCLQNLIQISQNSTYRITYFNEIISRFPQLVNTTELYYRLGVEYENEGEWDLALKSFSDFLAQEDASSIQITGEPDAYNYAQRLVDFNDSPKDWTFESLESLEKAVKTAITNYNYRALDNYKSKVNFFAMSWRQDAYDTNSQEDFSMRGFMRGNRIRYNAELDEASNPNEAYLRTWGWNNYVSVWYLYFRKVNFPIDPEIHGRWEWAGIYYGEML